MNITCAAAYGGGMDQQPKEEPLFATTIQFANRMQVSVRTVKNWISKGMPSVCVGRARRIRIALADEWLHAGGAQVRPDRPKTTRRQRRAPELSPICD